MFARRFQAEWSSLSRSWWRTTFARFVPAHFEDPIGLAARLWRSGDPDARFALALALGGVVLAPLDLLLAGVDRRRLARAPVPKLGQLFVCGAPRSGTTLVYQALIRALPVAWFSNLAALFPRSPLTATRLWGNSDLPDGGFRSYYGRTGSIHGSSDALQLWDRWLGEDRAHGATELQRERRDAMARFFGAYEELTNRPLVAKNNSLNVTAHLVAEALPTASFLCLSREPAMLAQSLLQARREIHGNDHLPYGIVDEQLRQLPVDPIEHVCRQALFYDRLIHEQQLRIGPERFVVVPYEAFCADPGPVLDHAARRLFGRGLSPEERARVPDRFTASARIRIPEEYRLIEERLGQLRGPP